MTLSRSFVVLIPLVWLLAACSSEYRLMPTPQLLENLNPGSFFRDTPAERRRPDVDLLYITNRAPLDSPDAEHPYGEGRSRSLAFGSATVQLGENLDWQELEQQSHTRSEKITLSLGNTHEQGRFPTEPYGVVVEGSHLRRDPEVMQQHQQTKAALHAELNQRLQLAPNGEVLLYVHGFNETFSSAAFTAAELCHFLGREDVCMFFTWPASASGRILTSYISTTESAAFAVSHLARTIRLIATMPEVKGVHLLAHSRGAGLTMDALSQLGIEYLARGETMFSQLKLRNVVLLSPDLDADIAVQRIGVGLSDPELAPEWSQPQNNPDHSTRITIYSSPDDRALLVSTLLFRSYRRIGRAQSGDLSEHMETLLAQLGRFDFLVYDGKRTDVYGHFFFTGNPLVSSDLVQLIRFGKKPGDPGRPLRQMGPVSWVFEEPQ